MKKQPANEPSCKIYFENIQNRVYYAGQVVTGYANLTINETVTVGGKYKTI